MHRPWGTDPGIDAPGNDRRPTRGAASDRNTGAASDRNTGPLAGRRGQSEVLGVVLLIGIVLVASSVLALYGFGLVGSLGEEPVPQASLDVERAGDEVVVTHAGGDAYTDRNTQRVVVRHINATGGVAETTWVARGGGEASFPVRAGDTVRPDPAGEFESGDRVEVLWFDPEEDRLFLVADERL